MLTWNDLKMSDWGLRRLKVLDEETQIIFESLRFRDLGVYRYMLLGVQNLEKKEI